MTQNSEYVKQWDRILDLLGFLWKLCEVDFKILKITQKMEHYHLWAEAKWTSQTDF